MAVSLTGLLLLIGLTGSVWSKPSDYGRVPGEGAIHAAAELGAVESHSMKLAPRPGSSGLRIIDGMPAAPGAWPWAVALTTLEGYFVCGASLITPVWLVSAAHCFPKELTDNYQIVAKLGATNLTANDAVEMIAIKEIILNPNYVPSYNNDIAMLSLARPANILHPFIDTIRTTRTDFMAPIYQFCYIIGWGATSASNVYVLSGHLTQMKANVITNPDCQSRWSRAWTRPKVYDYNICVDDVSGTVSACYGDSGSPLQCYSRVYDAWVLLGVSSWGSGSCAVYPSVYTRTSYYSNWIDEVINTRPMQQAVKDLIGKSQMPAEKTAGLPASDHSNAGAENTNR